MSDSNRDIRDINADLFQAAKSGDINGVKRLIKEGADVDALDGNKFTPLWHAIVKGNKDMVSLLIDNKADVNAQSETGRALLHVAVDKANITQTLDTSIIKALLEAEGINVNAVDRDGKTPLHEAAKSYDKKIVTVLLEAKGIYVTPLDNTSSTPLNLALQQGRRHIVKILEETQKDIEALYSAVKSDNYEEVQSLLSKKVNVNSIDNNGKTPLHWAVGIGHKEVVEALLGKGADVNAKDNSESTPLHLAIVNSHKEIAEALLGKEADVNAKDNYGKTPLHWAVEIGHKEIVEALMKAKANVNIKDEDGKTPLHLAAQNNNEEIVGALIKAGANINVKDKDEKTPLDLATDDKIKTLLQLTEKTDPVDESLTDSEGGQEKEKEEDVAPTEPAQTEEQPSSFFGSLFSILMKPFSLIGSFFGGFFSWLFGSDEPTQSPSESDQTVVLESPSNSVENDII